MLKAQNTTESTSLAPFEIWEVLLDNATIKFHQPLVLTPTLMPDDPEEPDDEEYLQVICPELGVDVYAENRDDLLEFVYSDIRFVWNHYVLKDDEQLCPKTRVIKKNHLAIAELVDG
jgi:hypothetical protein